MSAELSSQAWYVDLPTELKYLLLKLCDNADVAGYSFPSHEYLARRCNVTVRTVIRNLGRLKELGYLVWRKRSTMFGRTSNEYKINIDRLRREYIEQREVEDAERAERRRETPDNFGKFKGEAPSNNQSDTHVTTKVTPMSGSTCHPCQGDQSLEQSVEIPPLSPNGGKVKPAKDPNHEKYVLTVEEKNELKSEWNELAGGKFELSNVFTPDMEDELSNAYRTYKKLHKEGSISGDQRTKFEFAKILIHKFISSDTWWCDKNNSQRKRNYVATLSYILSDRQFQRLLK